MLPLQYFWLILLVVFIVAEALTVGLVSIWFAGGSLVAMILAVAGVDTIWQIIVFLLVSGLLLVSTRPIAMKYYNNKKEKTNYQSVIGTSVRITEKVDNFNQTGAAFTDGKEWTVRAEDDAVIIEKDMPAVVVAVEGVKLIVKPCEQAE